MVRNPIIVPLLTDKGNGVPVYSLNGSIADLYLVKMHLRKLDGNVFKVLIKHMY